MALCEPTAAIIAKEHLVQRRKPEIYVGGLLSSLSFIPLPPPPSGPLNPGILGAQLASSNGGTIFASMHQTRFLDSKYTTNAFASGSMKVAHFCEFRAQGMLLQLLFYFC